MLDECKGERLEEVLAVFSNAVLKKVLQESDSGGHKAIAELLAFENFSYSGERTILSALILAHKASLSKHLQGKHKLKAQYTDFADLLDLNERRITRRQEQVKQVMEERANQETISARELRALQDQVQKNWSGADEWLETIIHGDSRVNTDGVLGTPFDKVWNFVESGRIGDLEGKKHIGLLEQLEARVQDQEARLTRWQEFGKSLSKSRPISSPKQKEPVSAVRKKINLGFTQHQSLQVGQGDTKTVSVPLSLSLEEYTRLIENMHAELADVGKARPQASRSARQSIVSLARSSPIPSPRPVTAESPTRDEEWSSASETEEASPIAEGPIKRPLSHASRPTSLMSLPQRSTNDESSRPTSLMNLPQRASNDDSSKDHRPKISISIDSVTLGEVGNANETNTTNTTNTSAVQNNRRQTQRQPLTPPAVQALPTEPMQPAGVDTDLAEHILSTVIAASPSPTKTKRHTLSLAERTRLSMSRASHSKYSDLHDDFDDPADLPLRSRAHQSQPNNDAAKEAEVEKHADLIERTRKSMVGFEAAQQKAQNARRRSVKEAKKKQRESSYFERVEEEPVTPSLNTAGLIEGDPEYEDVFKSRPKIKTSPAVSPTRIWEDEEED
jgi:hypothetical protein